MEGFVWVIFLTSLADFVIRATDLALGIAQPASKEMFIADTLFTAAIAMWAGALLFS